MSTGNKMWIWEEGIYIKRVKVTGMGTLWVGTRIKIGQGEKMRKRRMTRWWRFGGERERESQIKKRR